MPATRRNKTSKRKTAKDNKENVATKSRRVSHPSYESSVLGRVLTVGQGDVGQLGLGEDIVERKRPAPVSSLEDLNVTQVACGGMHTVALTEDGEVYTWGCNDEGALGRKTSSDDGDEFIAKKVNFPNGDIVILQVSAGDSHTSALAVNGVVYAWGTYRDGSGAVGLTTSGISRQPVQVYPVEGLPLTDRAVKVSSGNDHTVVLTESGLVVTFGTAEQGQLGRVKECFSQRGGRRGLQYLLSPDVVRFKRKRRFSNVFTGSYQTFAICNDTGDVFAWGLNNYGQLGTGDTDSCYVPRLVDSLSDLQRESALKIAGGQHHSVAVNCNGQLYACGRAEYGRLGLGEEAKETAKPLLLTCQPMKQVACGEASSFAVSESGELYSWGLGNCLQLGTGEEDDVFTPTLVRGKNLDYSQHEIINVSSGGQHTAILARDRPNRTEQSKN